MNKTQLTGALVIFACIAFSPKQQERQYTVNVKAHLVNQFLMVINGQLDQLTAKDYKELTETIQPQIYQQYRRYVYEDSIAGAYQKHLQDSLKKRP